MNYRSFLSKWLISFLLVIVVLAIIGGAVSGVTFLAITVFGWGETLSSIFAVVVLVFVSLGAVAWYDTQEEAKRKAKRDDTV